MKYWLIPLWMILVVAPVRAEQDPLVLQPDTRRADLAGHAFTWTDPAPETDWRVAHGRYLEGGFQPPDNRAPNIGYSADTLWVAVPIRADNGMTLAPRFNAVLDFNYPSVDWLDVWLIRGDRLVSHWRDGDLEPEPSVDDATFRPYIPLSLPYDSEPHLLLVRASGEGSIRTPMTLWEAEAYYQQLPRQNFIWGAFYGVLLFVLVFNLFLWLSTRRSVYPPYLVFVFGVTACVALLNGHGRYLLGQGAAVHLVPWAPLFGFLALGALIAFTQRVLRTRHNLPAMHHLLNLTLIVNTLPILFGPWISYRWLSLFIFGDGVWLFAISLVTAWRAMHHQRRIALFYLTAWVPFLGAILVFMSRNAGWLPGNTLTEYVLPGGLVLAVVMLSLVLADSLKQAEASARGALEREQQALKALARNKEETTRQALCDPVTGLPNKAQAARLVDQIMQRRVGPFQVVILRPDNLRELLNTLGESNVDQLTRAAAQRLEMLPLERYGAVVLNPEEARPRRLALVEGRNFLVVLAPNDFTPGLDELAAEAEATLGEAIALPGLDIALQCTLGSACFPDDGDQFGTLVRRAQVAVDLAISRRQRAAEYRAESDPYQPERLLLAYRLKRAISNNELALHFQPQMRLSDRHIQGVEALVRWPQADGPPISPAEFIPIAERTGLISQLTDWVIEASVRASADLVRAGQPLCVSLNLSAHDLTRTDLTGRLLDSLRRHDLPPANLAVEVTESMLIDDWAPAVANLEALREAGIRISLDDFGTGYSSLSYLHNLPIDCLKVDQRFVQQLHSRPASEAMLRSIIQLAQAFELELVAEGVETEDVRNHLQRLGCGVIQGYWLARPMALADLQLWLADYSAGSAAAKS